MIFFKTRHQLKELNLRIQQLEQNLNRFFNTYNGTVNLVNEVTKLMYEHSAEVRKNTGGTFKLEDMKPDPVVPSISNGGIKVGHTNIDLNGDRE